MPPVAADEPIDEIRHLDTNSAKGLPGSGAATTASLGRVAIVHDYLNQRGGAEKVVLEMSHMWPDAPIYTSLYRPRSTFQAFRGRDIRTSFLDRVPVDRGFRNLFPLYPAAFWSFGEIDADVVVASTSGWAHMARVVDSAVHVVYCYTPARWLYRNDYMSSGGRHARRQAILAPLRRGLRHFDAHAAHRADSFVAISATIRRRIQLAYGIDAPVVYPPVETERVPPRPRGERLLVISRLLPYKRVDLVVAAARQLGLGLDVVGDGPLLADLRRAAGPDATFHGAVAEDDRDAAARNVLGRLRRRRGGLWDCGRRGAGSRQAGRRLRARRSLRDNRRRRDGCAV